MAGREHDVTIVGNGAIGCALALRLSAKHPSIHIALIGPSRRRDCASLAAGAMLSAFAELEAGALAFPHARKKLEASIAASKMWSAHLDLLNSRLDSVVPVRLHEGTYVVSNPRRSALDDANLDAIRSYLREYDEPFEEADPRTIPGAHAKDPSAGRRAIYIRDEGTVSAKHLHRAYDEALRRTPSVTVVDDEVASIQPADAQRLVRTSRGETFAARHVVIAAGVRTQRFIDQLGLEKAIPRIALGVGTALVVRSRGKTPSKVVRSPNRRGGGVYAVPYDDGYCYVGATSRVCANEALLPSERGASSLHASAAEELSADLEHAEIHKVLVGYRPTTMDTFPLFGQTSIGGIWIASGTKRDGLHLSPKAADELVTALDVGTQPFSGAFVPERGLILERGIPPELAELYAAGYADGNLQARAAPA
jgi:glycine oxidase